MLFKDPVPTAQQTYFHLNYKYRPVKIVEGNKIFVKLIWNINTLCGQKMMLLDSKTSAAYGDQ